MEGVMDPQDLVVVASGQRISVALRGEVGSCALAGCVGTIRRFTTPVVHPTTGERSEHVIFACSDPGCTCGCARASEESIRAAAAEVGYDLEQHCFVGVAV